MKKRFRKILVFYIVLLPLIDGGQIHAADEKPLNERMKDFVQASMDKKGPKKLDEQTRKEVRDYVMKKKNMPAKSFKERREAHYIVWSALDDLEERHGVKLHDNKLKYVEKNNLKDKIKDKDEFEYFMTVRKLWIMMSGLKAEYLCAGGDEEDAIKLRKKISDYYIKRNAKGATPEMISALEYVRDNMCPYGANNGLLNLYNHKKTRNKKKFNETMMRVIKEDQVEYDYMYQDSKVNVSFRVYYINFLGGLYASDMEDPVNNEELEVVSDALLTKHDIIFLTGSPEEYNFEGKEYGLLNQVEPIITFVKLLQKKGLYELSDKIIEKFLTREMAERALNGWKKEFAAYMEKWEAAGRKSRNVQ